jgi:hypothetical protein
VREGKFLGTYMMLGEFDGRMIRLDGFIDRLAISKDKWMCWGLRSRQCVGNLQDQGDHVTWSMAVGNVGLISERALAAGIDLEENREVDKEDTVICKLKMKRKW